MPVLVPRSLDEALDQLAAAPGAMLLAGGTDAMVEINAGVRRPDTVVTLTRVRELRSWQFDADARTVRVGAAVTYAELMETPLAGWSPALAQAARTVGSPQIRHAATLGGNVATASPAGDGLPVLAALDAAVHLRSASAERTVAFSEFITGPKQTVCAADELITAITVPVLDGWQGYAKVGVRNAMVISAADACLAVHQGGVRLALGSVGPTIIRCAAAESFAAAEADVVAGQVSDTALAEFGRLAAEACTPITDHRSTAGYRRHAIAVLASRLLRRACPHG
jgi:CO/xanthine dehydrogenase FAD-binding subunit